jgi:hypothetical protein
MYVGQDWGDLEPVETNEVFSLEFTKNLASGETLVSAAWSLTAIKQERGQAPDASAASRRIGNPTITSELDPQTGATRIFVNQAIGGCLDGNKYLGEAIAVTSTGRTPALHSHFWCRAAAADPDG